MAYKKISNNKETIWIKSGDGEVVEGYSSIEDPRNSYGTCYYMDGTKVPSDVMVYGKCSKEAKKLAKENNGCK